MCLQHRRQWDQWIAQLFVTPRYQNTYSIKISGELHRYFSFIWKADLYIDFSSSKVLTVCTTIRNLKYFHPAINCVGLTLNRNSRGKGKDILEDLWWGSRGSQAISPMRPCLSPVRKETGCSEWQVNWWDLRTRWSGPDVEARRAGDGMPANPPLFPTPPAAGAALQREEGPVQVSTFPIWLFPLQPEPHKDSVYFYWLNRRVACARRFSWHQRRNVSGQALEILGYYPKQRVNLWQTFRMISNGYRASH